MLVERTLEGDTRAFGSLVKQYKGIVFNVALRMSGNNEDAKDIAQQVFIRLYEKLGLYDTTKPFFSWVYRITLNVTINYLKHPHRRFNQELDNNIVETTFTAPNTVESRMDIQNAILNLSEDYRQVIVMKYYAGLSYDEISETIEVPVKTVKSRLFSARQKLKEVLLKNGIVEE
ncbi:RNA polymerase sigma factor [candidate division KSB1 bacterium]|nr:RNA polymerase sigma factor [candidate division KSB1 bacterium]